jgi:autotransporter strand-loop-strand O-heptosyltransferase
MKILFIAPHLSTGGMPQFLFKRLELLTKNTNHELFVVEFQCNSLDYVVHRNKIQSLLPTDNFYTLYEDKLKIFDIINSFDPDIIHIDGVAEELSTEVCNRLYKPDRKYRIVETCHDVVFNPKNKFYNPDGYAMCTKYHEVTFAENPGVKKVIMYPYGDVFKFDKYGAQYALNFNSSKINVLNVGLWTPGKNQIEAVELAKLYPDIDFHFVGNMAANFESYWKPIIEQGTPDNVIIHGERSDIELFYCASDIFLFNSVNECNPLVIREAISYGLPIIARKLPQYGDMFGAYISEFSDNLQEVFENVLENRPFHLDPVEDTIDTFLDSHIELYNEVINNNPNIGFTDNYEIFHNFMGKPTVEILGNSPSVFRVEFWDDKYLVFSDSIKINHWTCVNREYYTKWRIRVFKDEELVSDTVLELAGMKVLIVLDSRSLGDTIAWIPYVQAFKTKHNCSVSVSTYHNNLFEFVYPELDFVIPGANVEGVHAIYNLGWFYDGNKEPELPNVIPLQQAACNILGLRYKEIIPKIHMPRILYKHEKKYVAIATRSTAGCKHWNDEYWQDVINHLVRNGYDVINTSLESTHYENCYNMENKSMNVTMGIIKNCELFIGLSSGLSWLAWSLEKPVIMISNFTKSDHEFSCIRPTDTTVCHGCWNNKNFKFDKGDWNWCPIHKGTDRQFECHTAITPELVINNIKQVLHHK